MISQQLTLYSVVKSLNFPIRSRTRQGCPFSPLLFNIVLEVLAKAIRKEKKDIKGMQIGKKVKLDCLQMTYYTLKILKMPPENYYSSSMNLTKLQNTKLIYMSFYICLNP